MPENYRNKERVRKKEKERVRKKERERERGRYRNIVIMRK